MYIYFYIYHHNNHLLQFLMVQKVLKVEKYCDIKKEIKNYGMNKTTSFN